MSAARDRFQGMVGRSRAHQQLTGLIRKAAPHVRTALITGETGTGKELVARALHALGPRPDRPLIVVNCAMLSTPTLDTEVARLGSPAVSSPFEQLLFSSADGATLFLDEIAELATPLQAHLLRALEYGELSYGENVESRPLDTVVIASTNRNLSHEAAVNRFRRDLYYRLSVVHLAIPPLRERRDDILPLTTSFLAEFSQSIHRVNGVAAPAARLLESADWPGNVRQLRSVLQYACIRTEEDVLSERTIAAALSRSEIQAIAYRHSLARAGAPAR